MRSLKEPHSPIGVIPTRGYHSSISSPFARFASSIVSSATYDIKFHYKSITHR